MFENKKGRIRGVIFDLDGTLIDSSKGIIESLFSAIYSNGVEPAITVNDSHFFMGKSLKETLEILIPGTIGN